MHHLALCKKPHPGEYGQLRMQLFSERFEGLFTLARRLSILAWSRPERDEQLVLLAVGEEFHFVAEALEAGLRQCG